MKAIDTAYRSKCALIDVTRKATIETSLLSADFAETFFAQVDKIKIQWCEQIRIMKISLEETGVYLASMLAFDVVGAGLAAGWASAGFAGARAVMSRGKPLEAAEKAAQKLWWAGKDVEKNLDPALKPSLKAAQEARAADTFMPRWTSFYGPQDISKKALGFTAGHWVNNYNSKEFESHMAENDDCGIAQVEDKRFDHLDAINKGFAVELEAWPLMIESTMERLVQGIGPGENGTYIDGRFSTFAEHLITILPNYDIYQDIRKKNAESALAVSRLRKQVTVNTIQKAWANQQCSLQCGPTPQPGVCSYHDMKADKDHKHEDGTTAHPEFWCPADDKNTICQAVCWQGSTDAGNVPLYGIHDLAKSEWHLNYTDVFETSWRLHQSNATAAYEIVGNGQLLAWEQDGNIRQEPLPLLAVSTSEYMIVRDVVPEGKKKKESGRWTACNVGDHWGNQSQAFWEAGHWDEFEDKGRMVWRCRENFKQSMRETDTAAQDAHPGLLYANMARVLTHVVYLGNDTEYRKGRREEGDRENALSYLDFVDANIPVWRAQGRTEASIEDHTNDEICSSDGGKFDGNQRWMRRISDGQKYMYNGDESDDEGFKPTLQMVQNGCKSKKWQKKDW